MTEDRDVITRGKKFDFDRVLADVPDAILTAIQWQFYDSPTKAATMAMGLM